MLTLRETGLRGIWELSEQSLQFLCESKITSKLFKMRVPYPDSEPTGLMEQPPKHAF